MFKFLIRNTTAPVRHIYKHVRESAQDAQRGVEIFKDAQKRSFKPVPSSAPDIVAARAVAGNKERFQFLVQFNEWTPEALAARLLTLKHTQMIFEMFFIVAILLCVLFAAMISPDHLIWPAFMSGCCLIVATVMSIKVFNTAIFKTQLQSRELMTMQDFVRRPDCSRKIFLPYS